MLTIIFLGTTKRMGNGLPSGLARTLCARAFCRRWRAILHFLFYNQYCFKKGINFIQAESASHRKSGSETKDETRDESGAG